MSFVPIIFLRMNHFDSSISAEEPRDRIYRDPLDSYRGSRGTALTHTGILQNSSYVGSVNFPGEIVNVVSIHSAVLVMMSGSGIDIGEIL